MPDFEYSNGANGSCQECGEPTDEEWHEFCSSCWADQNGWRRPNAETIASQHEARERESITRLLERLGELELRISRLEQERVR